MPAIVEIPQVIEDSLDHFADLFANAPQRRHFAEYLTGLMVASNKTVSGIQAEFADTTDQSCLNRFLTEADWDEEAINTKRLELLQTDPSTRYHKQGVIALDDVLIDHDGKLIKDVGWFWDHAEQRYKIAHDDLFARLRLPQVKHPVRIVLIWKNRRDKKVTKVLVTNRTHWEINRILKTYRYRWTGTETFHRDGKQELGMGDCQLRSGQGQTRHMYLVMLAYSLLMKQLNGPAAKAWALKWLTTIGQACRAVANETLRTTLEWAMKQINGNSRETQHVIAQLGLI